MNREPLPFDHRADPMLGAALRHALETGDDAGFVARVLARADEASAAALSWDAVLARWARAGVAAAVFVALVAGYLVGRMSVTGGAAGPGRPSVAEILLEPRTQVPEVEVVLASVLEQ